MLSLFRIIKIKHLSKKLEELLNFEGTLEGFFNFAKLFFIIIYIAHLCACL